MKKIVIALMAIVMVIGLTGGAFAYFSDSASTGSSTITAGILDINDSGVGAVTFTQAAVAPGTEYTTSVPVTMAANNTLTPARTELDFDLSNFVNGATEWQSGTTSDDINEYTANIFVHSLKYDGVELLSSSADALGTPAVPLATANVKIQYDVDWNNDSTNDSVKLSTLAGKLVYITGTPKTVEITMGIPSAVTDNAIQGDKCDIVLNVAVAQDLAQASIVSG